MSDLLAYVVYLVWLAAGGLDFVCHRRTRLAYTSGVHESSLHLVQLALIGAGVLLWLTVAITLPVLCVLSSIVIAHAVVGYLDTRQAYARRDIRPIEQHLHSVLDIAPIAALCWAASGMQADSMSWSAIELRTPPASPNLWLGVLVPAVVLCGVPALLEFKQARAVALANRT
ncbi:hypothetical protein [Montanilutibacter psychrotolerans]|uniref:Diguanylate cyclase n=1 Tax=Montanilutibacter psychrotolerans TaxID=1327343 RepID=A0A3M8SV04_9GAMM|nr:hypothetical protein [Lysobacter psychrotolerans]RNF83306.1 hypothetical protein EER27_12500 [Lysobacter psychrotolerans]